MQPAEAPFDQPTFNPFPGLRPFEEDEDHLFFGRERQIDELLARLRTTRFLAVVGTSGSGKSSLVRSGLIPSLYIGFMAQAGSTWRVATFRPGADPIGQMAAALSGPGLLGRSGELTDVSRVLVETTLRRGTLGLVEAAREARIPAGENLLVVIDQFEELFRFQRSREGRSSRKLAPQRRAVASVSSLGEEAAACGAGEEAATFVKLLLEAAGQHEIPIYVVLTMRSDFLGDCMQYTGLPEAVTTGQYLVPRMARDELRSAITGPVAVARGAIAPRLVVRLLNDVSDDPDQLPVLQHALMRTWDHWAKHRDRGEPMEIADYEAIGTMRHALSFHAEEAYAEAESEESKRISERLFKALTDTFTDPRGVRRPTSVRELAAVCEAQETDLIAAIELFRRPGRSFLMPPASVSLESESIVDISHESVMRCWDRLVAWAEEERTSAGRYVRLARAAAWYEEGTGELWSGPTLEMGLQWLLTERPNAAWAARYDASFERAMAFLERSRAERDRRAAEQRRLAAEREFERRRSLRRARWVAGGLAALLATAGIVGVVAEVEANRASANFRLADQSVEAMLKLAGGDSRIAADVPQADALRKQLADTARNFFLEFIKQKPRTEELRFSMALAHVRLGDIGRILQNSATAIQEYQAAIAQLDPLARARPNQLEYRRQLASAYNWLGESERPIPERRQDALKAYDSAIALQDALAQSSPANSDYRQELARSHYNRGIVRYDGGEFAQSEGDYRAAVNLLEPLPDKPPYRQDLARVYNNLAMLLNAQKQPQQAGEYFGKAIAIHEGLTRQDPGNRDYMLELADFYVNFGLLLQSQRQFPAAENSNGKAIALFEELAMPAPAFTEKLAHAHARHGRILEQRGDRAAASKEYETAIAGFMTLEAGANDNEPAEFRLQYGDSLMYLGNLWYSEGHSEKAVPLLARAAKNHSAARSGNVLFDYYRLTQAYLDVGSAGEAEDALSRLSDALKSQSEANRASYDSTVKDLKNRIEQLKGRESRRN